MSTSADSSPSRRFCLPLFACGRGGTPASAPAEPPPPRIVTTYKTEDEVPQYTVTMRKWNLDAKIPDALFRFTPPEGANAAGLHAVGALPGGNHDERGGALTHGL